MKKCPKCLEIKEEKDYWKGTAYCRICYNLWKKQWRKENKDRISDIRKTQWKSHHERSCKNCQSLFVGKGRSREYCCTKCKMLHFVDKTESGCWEWKGDLHPNGYAYTTNYEKQKRQHIHRVSYEIFKGEIPSGKYICHHCDNRKCCNPNHLWVGTAKENMHDAKSKGRLRNQYGRLPTIAHRRHDKRSSPTA